MVDSALSGSPVAGDPRRWRALGFLGLLQFMLVLDVTVVNVALPKIETALKFSQAGLAWVVSAYVLMAGGLLLLGGRLGDLFGRRRLLLTGVVVFALSSALSGAAANSAMLVAGRFGQGVGEALAAPAALGIIAVMFSDPAERTKALGVWGGLVGIGGILGYIVSGVLTTWATWRWIFYINLPMAALVLLMVPRLVSESRMERRPGERLDVLGAVCATGGLVGVVYGLLQVGDGSWGKGKVLGPLVAGLVLLVVTVVVEARTKDPLIPLSFFADRSRAVATVTAVLFMAAFVPYLFMLTLFEQQVLQWSPLRTGFSYVPMGLAIGMGIGIGTGLTAKVGVRPVGAVGLVGAGVGVFLAGSLGTGSSYLGGVLPSLLVFGVFAGLTMPSMANAALHGVTGQNSGLASGVQATAQQVGTTLGVATLVAFATRLTGQHIAHGVAAPQALADGFTLAFRIGAVLLVLGGLLVAARLESGVGVAHPADPAAEAATGPAPEPVGDKS